MKKLFILAVAMTLSLATASVLAESNTMPSSAATAKLMSSTVATNINQQAGAHADCNCSKSQQSK